MEKTSKAVITPISFNWSDIGSWSGIGMLSKRIVMETY